MIKTTMMTLGLLALAGGCMTDDGTDLDSLGEETQALTGINTYSLTVSGTATGTKNLGSSSGRACFLTGVQGDISIGSGQINSYAGAKIDAFNGNWTLSVTPAAGDVTATAVCMAATGLTAQVTWTTGEAPKALMPVGSLKRCFLTAVSSSKNGTTAFVGGWHTITDVVEITSSGGTFVLGGASTGKVSATARCISATHDWGGTTVTSPVGGSAVSPLEDWDSNDVCALNRVTGHIDAAVTGTNMARFVGPALEVYWQLRADNGGGATMRCID